MQPYKSSHETKNYYEPSEDGLLSKCTIVDCKYGNEIEKENRVRLFCYGFLFGSELASIPDLLISGRTTNELLQAFFVYKLLLYLFSLPNMNTNFSPFS